MATMKQCDRCKEIVKCERSHFVNRHPVIQAQKVKNGGDKWDICDNCLEELRHFMREAPPKKAVEEYQQ